VSFPYNRLGRVILVAFPSAAPKLLNRTFLQVEELDWQRTEVHEFPGGTAADFASTVEEGSVTSSGIIRFATIRSVETLYKLKYA